MFRTAAGTSRLPDDGKLLNWYHLILTSESGVGEPRNEGPVELLALGRCEVRVADGDARQVVAQSKRFGLLAYLTLADPRGPRQRDELLALLWPTMSERRARQALSQSLYFLTKRLGSSTIRRDGKTLVGVGPGVTSDVQRFERLLAEDRLEESLAEYRGELLPGLHVTGCGDFERWLEGKRRRLRSRAVEAASVLSERCLAQGRNDKAVEYAKWGFGQLPYDEDAAVRLFELLSGLRRTGELRREFEAYERRLRDDLRLEPARYLRELIPPQEEIPPSSATPEEADSVCGLSVSRRMLRWRPAASLVGLVGLGIAAWVLQGPGGSALRAPERTPVTVLPFETMIPNAESMRLAHMASDWIAREVAASGRANVVAPSAATAWSVATAGDTDSTSSDASPYLAELSPGLVVTGHVRLEDGQITIGASIRDVPSMRIVRALLGVQGPTSEAMDVVEELGNRVAAALATVLDERIGSWSEVSSQPPSLEAYQAFLDGLDWFARGQPDSADLYFLEAARQDSQFTAPLIWAVRSRVSAHRIEEADSLAQVLRPRRIRLAPWDRAMLDYYLAYLHGTWEQAYQSARKVELLAPDPEWTQLVAASAQAANRPRAALEALARIDRDVGWVRDWPYRWRTWTIVHHMLGQYDEELAAAESNRGEHPIGVAMTELGAFAALGRLGAVDSTMSRLRATVRDPNGRITFLRRAVDELRAHGHADAASSLATEAVGIADSLIVAGDSTPDRLQLYGDLLYLAGRWREAHAVVSSIEKEDEHGTLLTSRGRAAARIGREREARQAAAELLTDDPLDKGHSTFRAATILAALGDEAEATNLLRRAVAEGFGFYPWLHAVWEFESLEDYEPFRELVRPRG